MSDTPRDQQPADQSADPGQPGRSAGAATASPAGGGGRGRFGWLRTLGRQAATEAGPESDPRQRRRRRWFVAGISAAAAVVVLALCAGTVGVISAVGGFRERGSAAREDRRLRTGDCLDLERRLNQLIPPGATTTPQARATAVRDENAAVRIYLNLIQDEPDQDSWRQLLDARTAYAEALDVQAKSRTPAFFVAPRAAPGLALTDHLVRWSPPACAGPIRRLSAPDL